MSHYFVSFRPDIEMEENLPPFAPLDTSRARDLVRGAAGVLLPAYVSARRYEGITRHAREWFPRLGTRFQCCGKTPQIELFRRLGARHPESLTFREPSQLLDYFESNGSPWGYPFVLKGDMGGGGSTVFPVRAPGELTRCIENLPGNKPLLIQRWVEHGGKDLRVVVYGRRTVSYFRIGDGRFYNNVCRGGRLDHDAFPELQEKGRVAVQAFCRRARIDIAGFDLMFPDDGDPVFIEINFHFGRKGLGGTDGHHSHILQAVADWREDRLRCLSKQGPSNSDDRHLE